MVAAVFDELRRAEPKRRFTVGIVDDVTHLSLTVDDVVHHRPRRRDGGVLRPRQRRHGRRQQGVGEDHRRARPGCTPRATSSTTRRSRARSPCRTCGSDRDPIRSTYLDRAGRLRRRATSSACSSGWTCSRSPARAPRSCSTARMPPTRCGTTCRARSGDEIIDRNGSTSSRSTPTGSPARSGMAGRINTVMQTVLLRALPACMPTDEAIAAMKDVDREDVRRARRAVVERNLAAVDAALDRDARGHRAARTTSTTTTPPAPVARTTVATSSQRVTRTMIAGRGRSAPGVARCRSTARSRPARRGIEKRKLADEHADLGSATVHRLRQVRDRLPARRDPDEGIRPPTRSTRHPTASAPRRSGHASCPTTS